jgi:pyruvate kinase
MREGDTVIMGENCVTGTVTEIARTSFKVMVTQSGFVPNKSAFKVPGARTQQLPVLTLEDKLDLKEMASRYFFDFVVVPTVITGRDLQELRLSLGDENRHVQIIAKIDTLDAVVNFENIVKHADGVVILRNELQMELDPEKLLIA